MSTSGTNGRPPAGQVINPKVIAETRRRGLPQTPQGHADAASAAGIDQYVPVTAAAINEGLREFDRADRERAARTDNDRFAEKMRREMEGTDR